ncbi:hypothetical protein SSS_00706 [Sarcoptes scabiei]|uniref:Uncharacterized protein n=1 Tax=Sarcoptes scabiei TaxID=52283 RepID=A0A132A9T0_SARSC|nr:hypothetical protein SSS_00706 [Sarcoptes scabiei]KPM07639.1 hypothetical protein QR98_0061380 [Sarcoptes scabiei]
MSSIHRRIHRSNSGSNRSCRFVELYFSSIDLLKLRLTFLRRNIPGRLPLVHLDYFTSVENDLERLKAVMLDMEDSLVRHARMTRMHHLDRELIFNELLRKSTISHLERIRLCRLIRVRNRSSVTLALALEKYQMVASYVAEFCVESIRQIEMN